MSETFRAGDRVRKCRGDYRHDGRVVCSGATSVGTTLYLVEFDLIPGMCHVYQASQLEPIPPRERKETTCPATRSSPN